MTHVTKEKLNSAANQASTPKAVKKKNMESKAKK
jgi:hypothetical protein